MNDPVNHPAHYTSHPSGVECIEITRHMSFSAGNAVKYLWRAELKNNPLQDLQKALWYAKDAFTFYVPPNFGHEDAYMKYLMWATKDEWDEMVRLCILNLWAGTPGTATKSIQDLIRYWETNQ